MIFDRFYGSGKGEINLLQVFSRGMTSPKNFLPDSLESMVESDLPSQIRFRVSCKDE